MLPESKTSPAMQKLLLLKSKISFFSGLTNQDIIELIENVKIEQYKSGDKLVKEGCTSNNNIYFLLKGSVDVIKNTSHGVVKVAVLSDPGVFGEMRALTGEARSTSIVAGKDGVLVISFTKKDSRDLGKALFYKNIINELSIKIKKMNEEKND